MQASSADMISGRPPSRRVSQALTVNSVSAKARDVRHFLSGCFCLDFDLLPFQQKIGTNITAALGTFTPIWVFVYAL